MKKTILFFLFLLLNLTGLFSQSLDELKSINGKLKDPFIKPEALDMVQIDLKQYESNPLPGQDTIMLDIYLKISSGYSINNHFKQAYSVYVKYLAYKENLLLKDKSAAINSATNSVAERERNDDNEHKSLLNTVEKLKNENSNFQTKMFAVKGNLSLALIILSSLFAIILLGSGIRLYNLKTKLNQSRERMKKLHHLALMGNFEQGLESSFRNFQGDLSVQLREISSDLKKMENFKPAKDISDIISGMEKSLGKFK